MKLSDCRNKMTRLTDVVDINGGLEQKRRKRPNVVLVDAMIVNGQVYYYMRYVLRGLARCVSAAKTGRLGEEWLTIVSRVIYRKKIALA